MPSVCAAGRPPQPGVLCNRLEGDDRVSAESAFCLYFVFCSCCFELKGCFVFLLILFEMLPIKLMLGRYSERLRSRGWKV